MASQHDAVTINLGELSSMDPQLRIRAAKAIKNAIIGNKKRKQQYLNAGVLSKLVDILSSDSEEDQLIVHVLAIVGSFAYGSESDLQVVLQSGVLPQLVRILIRSTSTSALLSQLPSSRTAEATLCTLKILLTTSRYSRHYAVLFDPSSPALSILITLLSHSATALSSSHGCRSSAVAEEACALLARGFEYEYCGLEVFGATASSTAAFRSAFVAAGGFDALQRLLLAAASAGERHRKLLETSVAALSALSTPPGAPAAVADGLLPAVVDRACRLLRDRGSRLRLRAAVLLGNVRQRLPREVVVRAVLPAIVAALGEQFSQNGGKAGEDVDIANWEAAAAAVARLVADDEELQKLASEGEGVTRLSRILTTYPQHKSLCRHVMKALAAIASRREASRKQVIDAKVLPAVVEVLAAGDTVAMDTGEPANEEAVADDIALRAAACEVVCSLSRSVKTLRTALLDSNVAVPLFHCLSASPPPVTSVSTAAAAAFAELRVAATAAVCNLVLDFSPMKRLAVEQNVVATLVGYLNDPDRRLRLNALWALRNLLYEADQPLKETIIKTVTLPRVLALLGNGTNDDPEVAVQALIFLRNLAFHGVDTMSREAGTSSADPLFRALLSRLVPGTPADQMSQALYVVSNIAAGNDDHKEAVMASGVVERLPTILSHPDPAVRVPAVWIVINLAWHDGSSSRWKERVARLKELGLDRQLTGLANDPDLDVKDRARTALEYLYENAPVRSPIIPMASSPTRT